MRLFIFLLVVFFATFSLNAKPQAGLYTDPELDELHIDIDDLKHAIKTLQFDFGLIDERLKKQDHSQHLSKDADSNALSLLTAQVSALEKKVSALEKTLEKAANDLRALNTASTHALNKMQELEQHLLSHETRFDEVAKLKGTLTNISKAINQRNATENPSSTISYRVKAGDSLEKIARNHHTSVELLRNINHLSSDSDKIVIGQELRLPSDSS